MRTESAVEREFLFLTMVHIMKEIGKTTTCQVMEDWSNQTVITKATFETDLPTEKETMKIFKKHTQDNGETISGMELDNKSSRIKNEGILGRSCLINTMVEENCMMMISFIKESLKVETFMVKEW